MRGRQVFALAVVVVLATGVTGVVGLAVADDHAANASGTDVDTVEPDSLTLEELREEGTRYSNSPDSVRLDGDRMMWLIHWPADALSGNPGDPNDDYWRYLSPGEKVDRSLGAGLSYR